MRERLLLKLHPHNPWLVLLQARPMLDAGDTQELDPGRPQGPWAGWLEGLLEASGGEGPGSQTGECGGPVRQGPQVERWGWGGEGTCREMKGRRKWPCEAAAKAQSSGQPGPPTLNKVEFGGKKDLRETERDGEIGRGTDTVRE